MSNAIMDDIISKPCIGIIELIYPDQRTIYYRVGGEKYFFSRVGRYEIYDYASVGDSLIKQANSKIIKVVKTDKTFKEFEIYQKPFQK